MPVLVMQSHSQRDDHGGSPIHTPRRNSGHMSQPEEVGMTTREACATLRDQERGDYNAAANDENKDYFSCSCPSAPLSSACSISSASGLSNSPFLSHSFAGQAITPLSMEGSECNVEGEPATRKIGRPPTPFDALAGLLTLDESVTSAPQNPLDESNESHEPAYNRPPTLPQAQPLDPRDTTARSHQPRDVCLPAEHLGLARDICREDTDNSSRTGRLDEAGISTTDFDGTDRRPLLLACLNGCACKCDDALDASQQPTVASQAEDFGDTSGPMLAGHERPNQGKQLQLRKQQHCCPTEPAAAEPEPRSGCSDPAIPVNGENHALHSGVGDPGMAPTSFPGPLNPSNPGANTHHPCAPEHDIRKATKPSADGPNAAARDGKIVNTKRISRNSSLTATASRDPPFSSSASPPSHPSSSVLPRPSLASIPASIEKSAQDKEGQFQPLVRRASDNSSLRIQHPIPDVNPITGALLGNIAQLEATAERLSSTTASIEDAIRDLHAELKRSDSQRSAAARARAGILSARHEADDGVLASRLRRPAFIKPPASLVRRRTVHSGRTTTTNQPARYRPRSGSLNAVMQSTAGMDPYMSRTGPGKGSVRSVRSGKQSLAEISESEPVGLTRSAFDEADRTDMMDGDDDTIRPHTGHDKTPKRQSFIPSTDAFHAMLDPSRAPNSELFFDHPQTRAPQFLSVEEQRPMTSASNASSTHTNSAFRDFDGVHCDPEVNFLPPAPQPLPMLDDHPPVPPRALGSERPPKPQPTSYLDNETGKEMLYYPARVPAMLSLPPKLSKKPKAAARNQRQSHVLSTMPEIARQSGASWLPDPVADTPEAPFLNPISLDTDDSFADMNTKSPRPEDYAVQNTVHDEVATLDPNHAAPEIHVTPTPADPAVDDDEVKPAVPRPRKDNATDVDARKSRLSKYNSNLPPQLRASAFFDLPSNSTKLEVKDGSAMATLDHLLDASTSAPVSAFTDHMIAGKLGSEVYGTEKRRSAAAAAQESQQHLKESDAKKRASLFHRAKKSDDLGRNARSESGTSDPADDEALPPGAVGYATLSPDSDEFDDNDKPDCGKASDGENEDNEEYYGPPTTLLAELQIRKQEQKNRTRPVNQAFPNGMHSTLLELDAVAEKQRKNRKGRRVNLAWEDPNPVAADAESEDEDVPLGVLFAGKATGVNDVGELNRPMGLMERREIEENEPLSQRRARLQGHDPGHKRQTLIPNSTTRMSANRLSQMPSLGSLPVYQRAVSPGNAEQEEVEGETLGERKRRLKKKEEEDLPQARPVSTDFSSELLGQFGGLKDEKKEGEDGNATGDDEEGEETLGQRRRRLQAEREGQGPRPAAHHASTSFSAPAKRLSMANILTTHPKRHTTLPDEERYKAQEALHFQRSQEERLAALRSQMPMSLEKTSAGATAGGFGNGRFNDGMGATGRRVSRRLDVPGADLNRSSVVLGGGMIQQAGVNSMLGPGAGQYGGHNARQQYNKAAGWYPQVQAPMRPGQPQVPMQMMPMQTGTVPNQGQSDSIERWRHSVMP